MLWMKLEISVLGLLIILLWGFWGFLYKYGVMKLGLLPTLLVTNLVYMLTNFIILLYLYRRGVGVPLSTPTLLVSAGTIFGVLASILFLVALEKYPGSIVVPLTALYPAVTTILAVLVIGERISPINALGILLALVAGYLLTR